MPRRARCNFCDVEGIGLKTCPCKLAAYCSDACFRRDIDASDGAPGLHHASCFVCNQSDMSTVVLVEFTEKESMPSIEPLGLVNYGGGAHSIRVIAPFSLGPIGARRHLTPVIAGGGADPAVDAATLFLPEALSFTLERYPPEVKWHRNYITLESGARFKVLVPPPDSKAISISCRGACAMVAVVSRASAGGATGGGGGGGGGVEIHIEFVHSMGAVELVRNAAMIVEVSNDVRLGAITGQGVPCPRGELACMSDSTESRIATLVLLHGDGDSGGGGSGGLQWGPPSLHPCVLFLDGRPAWGPKVECERLHMPGCPGVRSSGLVVDCGPKKGKIY